MINQIKDIVRQAGQLMREFTSVQIHDKEGKANFVTSADLAVQEYLVKRLADLIPDAKFIAEEKENDNTLEGYTWIIDPIDGTTNFIYDYKHSAISVALMQENEPVIGVIYNPYLDELFSAERGRGAYLNGERIEVSESSLQDSLVLFGTSPYRIDLVDKTFDTAKNLFLKCRDIRRSGSAALDLCYIACGRSDLFFEYVLSPWDFAAGSLIITEAGGVIGSFEGNTFGYTESIAIVAGNKVNQMEFEELISK